LPQFVLGCAFAMSVPMAFAATNGSVPSVQWGKYTLFLHSECQFKMMIRISIIYTFEQYADLPVANKMIWPKEKGQKDKQRSTKHTHKTKDRVTRTPLKTRGTLRCSETVNSSCSISGTRRVEKLDFLT
jgi:hypothetical protein